MTAGYNFGPLYASGFNGKGKTIAIIDAFGSPIIADDLHNLTSASDSSPCAAKPA